MRTFNVGIVGYGFMGKTRAYAHQVMPLFYDPLPARCRITHVCSGRESTARAAAEALGAGVATTDFRKVTECPDVDLVHICTPNHLHVEQLLSAMNAGKHILCDKPLTATLEEARQVERALPGYRGAGQMALHLRFFPATMRAKQLVDEGFLGQPLEFRMDYLHSGSADPCAPLKWKLSAAAGGGVIADLGSHVLDLAGWLLGDYAELLAATHVAYPERPAAGEPGRTVRVDAEDSVMVLARMKSGAFGHISATKIATGAEDELRFELHGSKGALRFNAMDPHHLEAYDASAPGAPLGGVRGWTRIDCGQRYGAPAAAFPGPKLAIGWLRSHLACVTDFIGRAAEGRQGDPGLQQGVRVQELIELCRTSAREGKWVDCRSGAEWLCGRC